MILDKLNNKLVEIVKNKAIEKSVEISEEVLNQVHFEINDEVYSKLKLENDIVPLFYARSATQEEWNPVVWARQVSNGKVFFDALGHDAESFNHPKHSEIIIRAKNWITDKEKDH